MGACDGINLGFVGGILGRDVLYDISLRIVGRLPAAPVFDFDEMSGTIEESAVVKSCVVFQRYTYQRQ